MSYMSKDEDTDELEELRAKWRTWQDTHLKLLLHFRDLAEEHRICHFAVYRKTHAVACGSGNSRREAAHNANIMISQQDRKLGPYFVKIELA